MVEKGNGTFTMGNGLDRQQRLIHIKDIPICVFRVRPTGTKAWEPRWCAESYPLGFGDDSVSCYVSRPTLRKAVTDVFSSSLKPLTIIVR